MLLVILAFYGRAQLFEFQSKQGLLSNLVALPSSHLVPFNIEHHIINIFSRSLSSLRYLWDIISFDLVPLAVSKKENASQATCFYQIILRQ